MSLKKRTIFALLVMGLMGSMCVKASDDDPQVFEDVSLMDKNTRPYYGVIRPAEDYEDSREPTCIEEQCMLGYVCCMDILFRLLESMHHYCGCDEDNEQDKDDGYITYTGQRFDRS